MFFGRKSSADKTLSPSQLRAFEFLKAWHSQAEILHLWGGSGMGKSTVLREFHRQTQGFWIDPKSLVQAVSEKHPFSIEEGVRQVLLDAIENHSMVIVDDFDHFYRHAQGCSDYIRSNYYLTVMDTVVEQAATRGTRLVLCTEASLPEGIDDRAWSYPIDAFGVEDYRHVVKTIIQREPAGIDFDALYRFAPNMNCRRIEQICRWLTHESNPTTEGLLEFVQSQGMSSNVRTEEVQDVTLDDLIGVDHIREALEENIILPLENVVLAGELGLTPKRGVILAGPPGTGKTMVGRALARRLRGKFFLVDGTAISGTDHFYYRIDHIFRQAAENSPSIVFIDDSDVIFESGREHGLYRYLLTKLDGLESKSSSGVCVMLTAMDLGNIPPALVRSGRIELWLETKLPDDAARRLLLEKLLSDRTKIENDVAWLTIIEKTQGFSGADLKRIVQDAKLKLASDMVKHRVGVPFEHHLLTAIDGLVGPIRPTSMPPSEPTPSTPTGRVGLMCIRSCLSRKPNNIV